MFFDDPLCDDKMTSLKLDSGNLNWKNHQIQTSICQHARTKQLQTKGAQGKDLTPLYK